MKVVAWKIDKKMGIIQIMIFETQIMRMGGRWRDLVLCLMGEALTLTSNLRALRPEQ